TGLAPVQMPPWHVSLCVQASTSLQPVPSALFGLLHTPVAGLQLPATWHWSSAAHTTGLFPVHAPAWQVSVCVQALPSLQGVPIGKGGRPHKPVPGSHSATTPHGPAGVARLSPITCTGVCRSMVVLSPSAPTMLAPQAQTKPSDFNATVCCVP